MQLSFDLWWFLRGIVHLHCSLLLECSFRFSLATLVLLQVWERGVPERSVLLLYRTFQCPSSACCSASSTDICSDPQSTLPLPAILSVSLSYLNCTELAQGLGFGGRAGDDWKGLNSTKFLKGPTVKVPSEKVIICGRDIISFNIISLDLKMSLWLISIFKDTAALNPFSSYSSHQYVSDAACYEFFNPIKVYNMFSFPGSAFQIRQWSCSSPWSCRQVLSSRLKSKLLTFLI